MLSVTHASYCSQYPGYFTISLLRMSIYGLLRSSLIMGVHPGCPVCLTVAASLVAVETNVGETISAAKVTFVCGLWSVKSCCTPFCGPFLLLLHSPASFPLSWGVGSECFSTSCGRLQGPPKNRCWCQVLSCLSCRNPCSAAVGGLWKSFQMPSLHRECLLGCSHPPCGRHAPANAACAVYTTLETYYSM